jgi:hypothetical protein
MEHHFSIKINNEWAMVQEYHNWRAPFDKKATSWLREFVTFQEIVNLTDLHLLHKVQATQ